MSQPIYHHRQSGRPVPVSPSMAREASMVPTAAEREVVVDSIDVLGPIPATIRVSTFAAPARTSTRPSMVTGTWPELVDLLSVHERREDKDGGGWSPAVFRPGTTRSNANAVEISCAVGDFEHLGPDGYLERTEALDALGLAYCLYSTYTSTPEDPRFR